MSRGPLLRQAGRELAGEAAPDLVGRQLREHRLAAAGQVRRQSHADVKARPSGRALLRTAT